MQSVQLLLDAASLDTSDDNGVGGDHSASKMVLSSMRPVYGLLMSCQALSTDKTDSGSAADKKKMNQELLKLAEVLLVRENEGESFARLEKFPQITINFTSSVKITKNKNNKHANMNQKNIWQAAEDGDLEQVKKWITLGVDVNKKDFFVCNYDIIAIV